jgi:hypothetical protein
MIFGKLSSFNSHFSLNSQNNVEKANSNSSTECPLAVIMLIGLSLFKAFKKISKEGHNLFSL